MDGQVVKMAGRKLVGWMDGWMGMRMERWKVEGKVGFSVYMY